jgi:arylsulfatase A
MYDGDRRTYAAMVEKVDEGVGMLLAELERQGIADNTLFVLSSDNGGERYSDNSPLAHHKSTLWEGGIRVPCLMRWPAKLPKGKVTGQVAITMDLSTTFAAVAGAQSSASISLASDQKGARVGSSRHIDFDGINLLPILTGEQPEQTRSLFWRIDRIGRQQKAVRHGQWKYLQDGNVEMLFDLAADVSERRDVFFKHPEIFADLKRRLAEWEAELAKEQTGFLVK